MEGGDRARVNLREEGEMYGEFSGDPPQSRKHQSAGVRPRASSPVFVTLPSNSLFYAAVSLDVDLLASYACH